MTMTTVFAEIVKAEKQADGTMLVSGPVSTASLDRDRQVCDAKWLDAAVPKWFGEGGNVREMHTRIAAGKALSYWKGDNDSHWVQALVVDPGSVLKVEKKVLTGFSVGIKDARVVKSDRAVGGAIVDGDIVEVSLVDRPANPECLLTVAKSDDAGHVVPVVEEQALVEVVAGDQRSPEAQRVADARAEVSAAAQDVIDALTQLGYIPKGDGIDTNDALRWLIAKQATPAAPAAPAAPEPPAATPADDTLKTWVADQIKAAVTEATKSHEAELTALRDDLAKVKAQPTPGGPVRVRTATDVQKAAEADKATLLAKADEYERMAATEPDRDVAQGYRELASRERALATR